FNGGGVGGRAKLDLNRVGADFHRVGDGADLQRKRDFEIVVDIQHDPSTLFFLETLSFDGDGVVTNGNQRGGVVTASICRQSPHDLVAVDILNCDFRARYGR